MRDIILSYLQTVHLNVLVMTGTKAVLLLPGFHEFLQKKKVGIKYPFKRHVTLEAGKYDKTENRVKYMQ